MQFVGCAVFVVAIFAVIAFVTAMRASERASQAVSEVEELRRRIERMSSRRSAEPTPAAGETTSPVPTAEERRHTTEEAPPPAPVIIVPRPEPRPAQVAAFVTEPPPLTEPQPEPMAAFISEPEPEPEPVAPPPAPKPHPPLPIPRKPFDWESLIGVKLFSWIAGIALVLAALFFLSYSVEHGWLSPTVRASLGMVTGIVLLLVCELRVARDYSFTANAMDGAGIAILYATLFAIHELWHLLPATAVFALMLVVTAIAVLLSIRRDSVFIALLGLVGGFATPALLSTGENKPIALFSYLLLLNGDL